MSNPHFPGGVPVRLYEAEASVHTVAAKFGIDPATIIDFSLNINPFGPPKTALDAARRALEDCNHYPDLRLARLRSALAARHGVAEDALFFGAGLDDVIKLLLHALTAENDRVLIHLPTFPRYELEARLRGCRLVLVDNDPPWTIDVERVAAALTGQNVDFAFLCSPNNPTGETLPAEGVLTLVTANRGTVFVIDEALIDPLDSGVVPLVVNEPNAIVLRTFSKYFGLAGVRIGYAIGPPQLLRIAELGRPPFNVTSAAEAAALAVLDDRDFVERCRGIFDAESVFFRERLERLSTYRLRGHHANMLLLEIDAQAAGTIVDGLAREGILVADAACFGGLGRYAAIRVSLRDRAANLQLLAAMERVQVR